jgi:hypothetical protein
MRDFESSHCAGSNRTFSYWTGLHERGVTHVADHKFRIGEQVELVPGMAERLTAGGIYEVVRQLPTSNGEFGYRIKSDRYVTCVDLVDGI